MKSLYAEGASLMHRLPARAKLIALMLIGLCLFLTRNPAFLAIALCAGLLVYLSIGLALRDAFVRLRPVMLSILVVVIFSLIFNGPEDALVTLLRLTTLVLFAAAVTATTTIAAFIDEITLLATPLERVGWLQAADVGLAVGLVIRFVPDILSRYEAIREAHRARGVPVRALTTLVPLIILTLRDADNVAAAIDARGFRRQ